MGSLCPPIAIPNSVGGLSIHRPCRGSDRTAMKCMYANLSPFHPQQPLGRQRAVIPRAIPTLRMSVLRRMTARVFFHQQAATLVCIAAAIELMCEPLALIFQYQLLVGVRGKPTTRSYHYLVKTTTPTSFSYGTNGSTLSCGSPRRMFTIIDVGAVCVEASM